RPQKKYTPYIKPLISFGTVFEKNFSTAIDSNKNDSDNKIQIQYEMIDEGSAMKVKRKKAQPLIKNTIGIIILEGILSTIFPTKYTHTILTTYPAVLKLANICPDSLLSLTNSFIHSYCKLYVTFECI